MNAASPDFAAAFDAPSAPIANAGGQATPALPSTPSPRALAERTVAMPVRNPGSTGQSRSFDYLGKVDQLTPDGMLVDFKTVSKPSDYIREKTISYQGELYALALAEEGVDVRGIQFRLVARPTIKLKAKQTPDEYEEECFNWLAAPGKLVDLDRYLNPARIEGARRFLWEVSQRILASRRNGCWLCNEHACGKWGRDCEFLPLCEAESLGGDPESIIAALYREVEDKHPELDGVTLGAERSVLTYSSASTLTLCERKYFWRYERGIRRGDGEERDGEALSIGRLFHDGRDVFLREGLTAALESTREAALKGAFGEDDVRRREQDGRKAAAMLKAAALKWPGESATAKNVATPANLDQQGVA